MARTCISHSVHLPFWPQVSLLDILQYLIFNSYDWPASHFQSIDFASKCIGNKAYIDLTSSLITWFLGCHFCLFMRHLIFTAIRRLPSLWGWTLVPMMAWGRCQAPGHKVCRALRLLRREPWFLIIQSGRRLTSATWRSSRHRIRRPWVNSAWEVYLSREKVGCSRFPTVKCEWARGTDARG